MVERWIPDPLVIAVLLTDLVLILSVTLADYGILQTVDAWGSRFWSLLLFTGQIILILVLGYAQVEGRAQSAEISQGHFGVGGQVGVRLHIAAWCRANIQVAQMRYFNTGYLAREAIEQCFLSGQDRDIRLRYRSGEIDERVLQCGWYF